jgi:hypothetical protein
VPEYWRKVLSGAWDRTYNPLGWNAKRVAVVLIAVGTIVAADVHLGLAAMITSAVGYLWIAVPVAFAAIILFVWGFLQTTASLYADLGNTSRTTISELEAALAQYQKPAPDYEAWRHVDRLTLREAAFLWCDLSPGHQCHRTCRLGSMPLVQQYSAENCRLSISRAHSAILKLNANWKRKALRLIRL